MSLAVNHTPFDSLPIVTHLDDAQSGAAGPLAKRPWPRPSGKPPRLWLVLPVLLLWGACLGYYLWGYHVSARPGCDQNGYLCTARMLIEHRTLSFQPSDPFQFAGLMMVKAPSGRIYAKYPFGYPALAAIGRLFHGISGMYSVNPICTVLASVMSFFLFRTVVGDFASMMGMMLLTCNPVTLAFANDANSHSSSLLCVVIGFWGLLRWWQMGSRAGAWRGFIGGLALGYACTIRYTEFLLLIPLLFAALSKIRFDVRRIREALPPLIGWSIPITVLAIACWVAYGRPWLTGYSMCKEQTGFGWRYFLGNLPDAVHHLGARQGNWETLLYQLNHTGLFLILGIVLPGLIGLFGHSWRLATLLVLWILPPTLLYMFYYWAPAGEDTVSYLRFFLTVFPGLTLAGVWLMERALIRSKVSRHFRRRGAWRNWLVYRVIGIQTLPLALAMGAVVAVATSIDVANITPQLDGAEHSSLALKTLTDQVQEHYPAGNVVFADESACEQLDNIGGYQLYDVDLFRPGAFQRFKALADVPAAKQDDPSGLQRSRAADYMNLLGKTLANGEHVPKPATDVDAMMSELVVNAMKNHQRVAVLIHGNPQWNMLKGQHDLQARKIAKWELPPPLPPTPGGFLTRWQAGKLQALEKASEAKPEMYTLYEIEKVKT